MLDTTPVTTEITRLTSAPAPREQVLLVAVAQLFPNITIAELSTAQQVATATVDVLGEKAKGAGDVNAKYGRELAELTAASWRAQR